MKAERSHTNCEILIFSFPEVPKWKLRLAGKVHIWFTLFDFALFFLLVCLLLLGFIGVKV